MIQGTETVTVRRFGSESVDKYGNPELGYSEFDIPNVLVAFGSSTEPVDAARNPIDSMLTLYLPHGTVIEPSDVFIVRGDVWVKDGDPQEWPTVAGFEAGVVVELRRRRG